MTSLLSCVMSNNEFVTFPLVSWVWRGDCIVPWYLHYSLLDSSMDDASYTVNVD